MSYLIYDFFAPLYITINQFIIQFASHTQWTINQSGELHRKGWYFLMANHRSWADILVLQMALNRKTPMLKFFMKKELLWTLPIGGVLAWLLDFPVMQRHTKEYLKKHPDQRNKDIETTRKKCESFKTKPVTITGRKDMNKKNYALDGTKVLVVDDNETNRRILKIQLENWDMKPSLASSAMEALELLKQKKRFRSCYSRYAYA